MRKICTVIRFLSPHGGREREREMERERELGGDGKGWGREMGGGGGRGVTRMRLINKLVAQNRQDL